MIRYGLSKQDGRILFEPQEEQSSILLMTFDQFQKEKKYPHHLVLEKSIRTARYCKVEIFAECVQGTICIPKKQEEGKEKLIFGFYLNQEGILLVGDEKRLSALIGKMSQSVRGCMTPRHFLLLLLFCIFKPSRIESVDLRKNFWKRFRIIFIKVLFPAGKRLASTIPTMSS